MSYSFGSRSIKTLVGVHPDLVLVCYRAIQITTVDFGIIQGVRTQGEQDELYAQGRTTAQLRKAGINHLEGKPNLKVVTWTRNSNHLMKKDGWGWAVDVGAYVNGIYQNGDTNMEIALYKQIAVAMKQAAKDLKISIEWGPDVGIAGDWGHYQKA